MRQEGGTTQQLGRRNTYTPRDAAPVPGSVAAWLNSSERVGAVLCGLKTRPNNSEEHLTPKPKGGGGQDLRVPVLNMRAEPLMPTTPKKARILLKQAVEEGLISIFVDAGAFVCGATCGACLGGYLGVLAKGERCISTTNRNFIGRMGHKDSEVYLANPAVVAASAVTGRITDPGELE